MARAAQRRARGGALALSLGLAVLAAPPPATADFDRARRSRSCPDVSGGRLCCYSDPHVGYRTVYEYQIGGGESTANVAAAGTAEACAFACDDEPRCVSFMFGPAKAGQHPAQCFLQSAQAGELGLSTVHPWMRAFAHYDRRGLCVGPPPIPAVPSTGCADGTDMCCYARPVPGYRTNWGVDITLTRGRVTTPAGCAARCEAEAGCRSFMYKGDGKFVCALLSATAADAKLDLSEPSWMASFGTYDRKLACTDEPRVCPDGSKMCCYSDKIVGYRTGFETQIGGNVVAVVTTAAGCAERCELQPGCASFMFRPEHAVIGPPVCFLNTETSQSASVALASDEWWQRTFEYYDRRPQCAAEAPPPAPPGGPCADGSALCCFGSPVAGFRTKYESQLRFYEGSLVATAAGCAARCKHLLSGCRGFMFRPANSVGPAVCALHSAPAAEVGLVSDKSWHLSFEYYDLASSCRNEPRECSDGTLLCCYAEPIAGYRTEYASGIDLIKSAAVTTAAKCASECDGRAGCKGFMFRAAADSSAGVGTCALESATSQSVGLSTAEPWMAAFRFYDRAHACRGTPPPPPAPTTLQGQLSFVLPSEIHTALGALTGAALDEAKRAVAEALLERMPAVSYVDVQRTEFRVNDVLQARRRRRAFQFSIIFKETVTLTTVQAAATAFNDAAGGSGAASITAVINGASVTGSVAAILVPTELTPFTPRPTESPAISPSAAPSSSPTAPSTEAPTEAPPDGPTESPSFAEPEPESTASPTALPSESPTLEPTQEPTTVIEPEPEPEVDASNDGLLEPEPEVDASNDGLV